MVSGMVQASCMLSHDLTNKLAAIVAYCDLLEVETDQGSVAFSRMEKIKKIALSMDEMLQTSKCTLRKPSASVPAEKSQIAL